MQVFPLNGEKHPSRNSWDVSLVKCRPAKLTRIMFAFLCCQEWLLYLLFLIICLKTKIPPSEDLCWIWRSRDPVLHDWRSIRISISMRKKRFHYTVAIYLHINTSDKPPHEGVKTSCWYLRGFPKCRCFRYLFLIVLFRFCAILVVMKMQLLSLLWTDPPMSGVWLSHRVSVLVSFRFLPGCILGPRHRPDGGGRSHDTGLCFPWAAVLRGGQQAIGGEGRPLPVLLHHAVLPHPGGGACSQPGYGEAKAWAGEPSLGSNFNNM